MTESQSQILRTQVAKVQAAEKVEQEERAKLRNLLVMLDPRFADPNSGIGLDLATMQITEPPTDTAPDAGSE